MFIRQNIYKLKSSYEQKCILPIQTCQTKLLNLPILSIFAYTIPQLSQILGRFLRSRDPKFLLCNYDISNKQNRELCKEFPTTSQYDPSYCVASLSLFPHSGNAKFGSHFGFSDRPNGQICKIPADMNSLTMKTYEQTPELRLQSFQNRRYDTLQFRGPCLAAILNLHDENTG